MQHSNIEHRIDQRIGVEALVQPARGAFVRVPASFKRACHVGALAARVDDVHRVDQETPTD